MTKPPSDNPAPPAPEAIARYRTELDALMAQALQSVRAFDIPAEAQPLQSWGAGD